jgi:glucose/arabinose dehydrogenase
VQHKIMAGLSILIALAGLLAGCGSPVDGASGTAMPTPQPTPTLRPERSGPPCRVDYRVPYYNFRELCTEVMVDLFTFTPAEAAQNVIGAPPVTPPAVRLTEAAPALAGLAFDTDGTLYLAFTAAGEIWAMPDRDGDQFPERPERVAEGLRLPVALAVDSDGDTLLVSTARGVLRLSDVDGDGRFETHTTLLPFDAASKPGSVRIGPDGRLYASRGASCATCDDGALLSAAPDGSDVQVVATGFTYPADFDWHPASGELWLVDQGRVLDLYALDGPPAELHRIRPGENPQPPVRTLPYQSTPSGVVFAEGAGFSDQAINLIVALHGSTHLPEPAGYALEALPFDAAGDPLARVVRIAPTSAGTPPVSSLAAYSLSGRGFFPEHPVDVALSPQGWLYLSTAEGRVLRYRPQPPR